MASKEAWLDKRLLASRWVGGNKPCNEQQEPLSCRLSLSDGLLCIGIVNEEPPYAEPHVRWCERSENESRKKTTSFSSYSIEKRNDNVCDNFHFQTFKWMIRSQMEIRHEGEIFKT